MKRRRRDRGPRFILRLMDAATSGRNAVLAPLLLAASVGAGLYTGSADVFRAALVAGAAIWGVLVYHSATQRRPGDPEDVLAERERILLEIETGLDEAAKRLLARANQTVRRGRPFRPDIESGYNAGEWQQRREQLRRIYDLADNVERVYGAGSANPHDATALIAQPELPRQLEQAVRLARRRVAVLSALYGAARDEIEERLRREEAEAAEPGVSEQLRSVRAARAAMTRRELETYIRLQEERETLDALLDSLESFLRRLSFRTISTAEVQDQIAEIDRSLEAHDRAMEDLRQELRRASSAEP
jgi:hypothetical protein